MGGDIELLIRRNRRKKPESTEPSCVRYASCFIAMQMGKKLLADLNVEMKNISHQNFQSARELIDRKGEAYFKAAVQDIQEALQELYGEQDISLQQLSATFRRGDLISQL